MNPFFVRTIVIYDRYKNELRVSRFVGHSYEAMTLTESKFWFAELELGLGIWQGCYQEIEGLWLRWYDAQGIWLPTPKEQAQLERERAQLEAQRADQEAQRADQAAQRAERLAAKLRELGVDPNE